MHIVSIDMGGWTLAVFVLSLVLCLSVWSSVIGGIPSVVLHSNWIGR